MTVIEELESRNTKSYFVAPWGKPDNLGTEASPWPSVEAALNKVGGGNTIILMPGVYRPIYIWPQFLGTEEHPTVIKSQKHWEAIIDGTGINLHGITTSPDTHWFIVDGVTVRHAMLDGIKLQGDHSTIVNCWIHQNTRQGLSIHSRNYSTIEDNLIEYNGSDDHYQHGMYVSGSHIVISGNIVRHNSAYGLHLYTSISNSLIVSNLSYGNDGPGAVFAGKDGTNYASGNTFLNNASGFVTYGNVGLIENNYVNQKADITGLDEIQSNVLADYLKLAPILFASHSESFGVRLAKRG